MAQSPNHHHQKGLCYRLNSPHLFLMLDLCFELLVSMALRYQRIEDDEELTLATTFSG
jgi:hypothetical protein